MSFNFKREDWGFCDFEEVFEVKGGSQPPKSTFKYEETDGYIRLLQIRDFGNKPVPTYVPKDRVTKFCDEDDVLIARYGASLGRIVTGMTGAYNVALAKVIPIVDSIFNTRFVFYMLQTTILQQPLKMISRSAQNGFAKSDIARIKTPLAPLPEQRAIVAKIEELFSDLDKGIADLKTAQDQLKVYRQAVLKKAFEGELTKDWREQQTDLPTADELLEQIKEERQKHYEQQVENWKQAVKAWEENGKEGKKPGKPKTIKALPALTKDELDNLPDLNKFWKWSTIDNIAGHDVSSLKAGPFGSSLKKSFYTETGYKIYGQEQVISGDSTIGNYYVNEEKFQSLINCAIAPFDILISLVGTVGKVLVLPEDCEKGIINPRLVKVTLNNFYEPIFFKYYFESSFLKSLYKLKNHGTTMDVLNLGSIKELPYPICSKEEQHQIVQEIESRLSVCDKVEQSITESLDKAKALRQSILKKAFEGTLLSDEEIAKCKQAPDYEPASVLLARIERSRNERIKKETLRQAQGDKKKK